MIVNSNNLEIRLNGVLIPFVQSSSFSFSNSLIEVTREATNGYSQKATGAKSGTFSINGLLSTTELNRYATGDLLTVRYGIGNDAYVVSGRINSIEYNGGTDDAMNFSISIDTTSEITRFVPIIEAQFLQTRAGVDILTRSGDQIQVRTQTN